ncbi:uncharacterized protein LOC106663605 [Cimex lectularius]|uniref:Uncharacterized protein n=1 Tax=Cimex lectularius TaxID=79782 RepID=A0A8I6SJ56_CIMLE|nr:uncharacterized protein LOC106663605 [Cimex lectularius]
MEQKTFKSSSASPDPTTSRPSLGTGPVLPTDCDVTLVEFGMIEAVPALHSSPQLALCLLRLIIICFGTTSTKNKTKQKNKKRKNKKGGFSRKVDREGKSVEKAQGGSRRTIILHTRYIIREQPPTRCRSSASGLEIFRLR